MRTPQVKQIQPGQFEPEKHWYEKALNATIHPMVNFFFNLSQQRIVNRYCHLHPIVQPDALTELLSYQPKFFRWAGCDLLNVTSAGAKRQMVVLETNSCPSGQKSMPLRDDNLEQGGYRQLVEHSIKPLDNRRLPKGALAVIYDKNPMEASGYAAAMADGFKEPVYLIPYYLEHDRQHLENRNGLLILHRDGTEIPIRLAFRYLTQKPWNRLPVNSKTLIFNPIIACLAGGRNKLLAAKAYDYFNAKWEGSGLSINMPETFRDVSKEEIPFLVQQLGGQAVIKIPYSNAGQGVFTIVHPEELEAFMQMDFYYDQFIVQSLIGNYKWSSETKKGRLYHVGTVPDKRGHSFVSDIRMMICQGREGFMPLSIYARRAEKPLVDQLKQGAASWSILGTNLSYRNEQGAWASDTNRLMLMDRRDFNRLGVGVDDLIEAYIQTVLSVIAIDELGQQLINTKGALRKKLFNSLNSDKALMDEIMFS